MPSLKRVCDSTEAFNTEAAPSAFCFAQVLNFSALLIPTMDSVRAEYIMDIVAKHDATWAEQKAMLFCSVWDPIQ